MPMENDARAQASPRPAGPRLYGAIAVLVILAASGCATLSDPMRGNLASDSPSVSSCAAWFQGIESVIDQAGVRDAAAYRIPGFPYLRSDRFSASFREQAVASEGAFAAWLRRLRELDSEARRIETRNLPEHALDELGVPGREQAMARSEECAAELERNDLASAPARALLVERAQVPDDYSDLQRALGLYGLTRIPFSRGVDRWHEEALAMFRQARDGTGPARGYRRYSHAASAAVKREDVAEIFRRSARDPLGVPRIAGADLEKLFAAFAPVFEIETTGTHDRFGSLAWSDTPGLVVDTSHPVAYRRVTYTRYGDRTLVQLAYTIWFPERPSDSGFDILAGRLDGVVLRVTLSPEGEPLVYDSIHPCGCYHMFFPTPLAQLRPAPEPGDEWALIPATLPVIAAGQRIVVRVASRTHYLLDIAPDPGGAQEEHYEFLEENSLRSLPAGGDRWRSAYGPDGLVAGTERGERMLFWPMGIASAGAMRQWGKHATAFLGRRHFDDADLIERRFSLSLK